MALWTLGINHKTASLDLREKVAFSPDTLAESLQLAVQEVKALELAILSTCNRTEFYFVGQPSSPEELIGWLAHRRNISLQELAQSVYQLEGEQAVRHMMRVAAGLDSMILGEPQILGQMKTAYQDALQAGTLGGQLDRAFQNVFACAKQVRSDTAIGANAVSVGYAAVALARQIFSDLKKTEALLIGAGEMIELVGRHLQEQGVSHIVVANRTLARALTVAEQFGGRAISLADIPVALASADIVISSTASPLPLLGKGMVESALHRRRHKPILMIDIAVPRDIEQEVGNLDDVYLYTVDDLQGVIEDNRRSRESAAVAAEQIVKARAQQFMSARRELDAVETLTAFREQMESWRRAELEKAQLFVQNGGDPAQALERLSRALVNKAMHTPTVQLRKAAAEGRIDLLDFGRALLGIAPSENEKP